MNKEIIATYAYELPLPSDEEIYASLKEEYGLNIDPERIRTHIKQRLYNALCNATTKAT